MIVSDVPGHDARRDRHGAPARRRDLRPRRHGRPAAEAEAAAGDRVLLASCARSRRPSGPTSRSSSSTRARASSTRTSPSPTWPGRPAARRSSSSRSGTSTEVDDRGGRPRSSSRRLRQRPPVIAVSAKTGRGLDRAARAQSRRSSRSTPAAIPTAGAEQRARASCARRGSRRRSGRKRLNLLYGAQVSTRPPRFRYLRQRPGPRHARLRLLGRERAARDGSSLAGRAGLDRLRARAREESSSSAAARGGRRSRACSAERGHDVTLACRDPEQARGDRGDRTQPALPAAGRPARDRRADDRGGADRGRRARRRRRAEPRVFGEVVDRAARATRRSSA